MLNALERRFKLPVYLMSVMKNYLKDRTLLYDTDQGQRTKALSGGAAQGSILGPYLWNVTYDDLLGLEMPRDTELVAYADDVGVLITAHTVEEAQRHLNEAMRRVKRWMNEHSLSLAEAKTQIVVFTRKRIQTSVTLRIGETDIQTASSVKYLGVILDTKVELLASYTASSRQGRGSHKALSRLMANTNGPKCSKRRLLMSVMTSIYFTEQKYGPKL